MSDAGYGAWWDAAAPDLPEALLQTYCAGEDDYASRGWNGDANTYGARHYIQMARLGAQSRVLEIGCGPARVGREMAPHVSEWHGADVSPRMLEFARSRCSHLRNVRFHELAEPALPMFPADHFDFVYSTTVFISLDKEDLYQYLLEAARVMKPDGHAFFDAWNLLHPDTFRLFRQTQERNLGDRKSRGRYQFVTPSEMARYLEEAGLSPVRMEEERLVRVLCRRRPTTIHEPDDGLPPFGYVSCPANEARVGTPLVIDGWALDAVVRVTATLDGGRPLHPVVCGLPRPDVAAIFPRYADAGHCGFRFVAEPGSVPPGRHTLEVVAVDRNGKEWSLVGHHLAFTLI